MSILFTLITFEAYSAYVTSVKLERDHIDLKNCIESGSEKSNRYYPQEKRFEFACKGETARKLYYKVGYSREKSQIRYVGLTGEKSVKLETDHSFLICQSFPVPTERNVIVKRFSCLGRLTAADERLTMTGSYENNLQNGSFEDHLDYIDDEFDDKTAIAKVTFNKDGFLVENDTDASCRPALPELEGRRLAYECTEKSPGPSFLVMYPKY